MCFLAQGRQHTGLCSLLPWWGRCILGILSRDPQCTLCGHGPALLATPGSSPGPRRSYARVWLGLWGVLWCAPPFQGREGCDLTAKGMVCLAL